MENITDRTLSIKRTFDAPIELLWKALTTPELIIKWWGPDGFTNTIKQMEPTQGGKWEFIMHGPDGTDYENSYIYEELVPMTKVVLKHQFDPCFTISIVLTDEGDQTTIEWTNIFESVDQKEELIKAVQADKGLEQNMNKLGKFLKELNLI